DIFSLLVQLRVLLPLTLIAGWYGMNFQMPEYGWEHGVSLWLSCFLWLLSSSVLHFSKKNKWF
ncbi:MAG: CorA family divalent cation transporter, partial [Anaerotignum sp.]